MSAGVRERARDAMRAELADELFDVLVERGFDQVTVEDVARQGGISRATFFRYFGSKEDLVVASLQSPGSDFGAAVRALGQGPDESLWALVRRALAPTVAAMEVRHASLRPRLRMISSHPSLRGRLAERRVSQEESLADALAERSDPRTARVLAVVAMAAFDLAWREWSDDPDALLGALLDDCFTRLGHGLDTPAR